MPLLISVRRSITQRFFVRDKRHYVTFKEDWMISWTFLPLTILKYFKRLVGSTLQQLIILSRWVYQSNSCICYLAFASFQDVRKAFILGLHCHAIKYNFQWTGQLHNAISLFLTKDIAWPSKEIASDLDYSCFSFSFRQQLALIINFKYSKLLNKSCSFLGDCQNNL